MYVNIESFPSVRLLNLSGEVGCANPGHGQVIAPVVRFSSIDRLVQPSAVLLPLDQMSDFFLRLSNHPELYHNVAGVLVESNGVHSNVLEESTQTLQQIADKNEKSNNGYQANVAEFDLVMQDSADSKNVLVRVLDDRVVVFKLSVKKNLLMAFNMEADEEIGVGAAAADSSPESSNGSNNCMVPDEASDSEADSGVAKRLKV